MDVDQGKLVHFHDYTIFLTLSFLEFTSSGQTVCLPYAFVPGMDMDSFLFHKANATLAKQIAAGAKAISSSKGSVDRLFSAHQGMSVIYFNKGHP